MGLECCGSGCPAAGITDVFYRTIQQIALFCAFAGIVIGIVPPAWPGTDGMPVEWRMSLAIGLPILSLLVWMIADVGSRLPPTRRAGDDEL